MKKSIGEKLIDTISKAETIDEKIEAFHQLKNHLTQEILSEAEKHEKRQNQLLSIHGNISKT